MIASFIFFALVAVFVIAAVQAARETLLTPGSRPGSVVDAEDGSGERMNVSALICTCTDWQRRRGKFRPQTPMRLCPHLTAWYARRIAALPETLLPHAAMIALLAREGQGLPCGPGTEYGHLDEASYVLYISGGAPLKARLILAGRRYELSMDAGEWFPSPPPRESYFLPRARQLANAIAKKH